MSRAHSPSRSIASTSASTAATSVDDFGQSSSETRSCALQAIERHLSTFDLDVDTDSLVTLLGPSDTTRLVHESALVAIGPFFERCLHFKHAASQPLTLDLTSHPASVVEHLNRWVYKRQLVEISDVSDTRQWLALCHFWLFAHEVMLDELMDYILEHLLSKLQHHSVCMSPARFLPIWRRVKDFENPLRTLLLDQFATKWARPHQGSKINLAEAALDPDLWQAVTEQLWSSTRECIPEGYTGPISAGSSCRYHVHGEDTECEWERAYRDAQPKTREWPDEEMEEEQQQQDEEQWDVDKNMVAFVAGIDNEQLVDAAIALEIL